MVPGIKKRLTRSRIADLANDLTDAEGSVLTSLSTSAIQGEQVYGPFGASSYQSGTINTAKGYTGQVHDGVSGLDYYVARYYDPTIGMFLSVDTVQGNQQGMNPYQYTGDNPETHNDPSGHCWPLCTMLIGAAIGAVIGVASTVVTNAVQGKPTSMGQIAQAAVVGAVSGAIAGLAGPEAGPLAKVAIGALSSGAGQLVGNAMSGKPLMDGVAQATIVGGVTGGLVEGAGALVKGASGEAGAAEGAISEAAGSCGLSFRSDTLVATPTGEQAISTLNVGDHVQAYNPVTKTISTQTVQRVFINHDTDLMDVTLAVHPTSSQTKQQQAAVVSHGSHAPPTKTEVVHTTQKHPWLTTKGWITAGQLHLGNEVQLLDGATATVVGLKIIPGMAAMYDLTVSNIHTFAVGNAQFVVHNCPNTTSSSGSYDPHYEDKVKMDVGDSTVGEENSHQWNGSQPVTDADGIPVDKAWAGPDAVKGYGTSDETWVEAKQTVPDEDVFAKARNFRQLMRYATSGRPFTYYMTNKPNQASLDLLRFLGGNHKIF